ncbi:MAG TPA: hypothetical protein VKT77_08310 [Chthonomonadaceae bacterium]|nr:hypothetical protein [Chthonomonadaceae bacterium]
MYPMLLQHGADVNARDHAGQTALIHLFTSSYRSDSDIRFGARFLIVHGALVSIKDHAGKTALDYALEGRHNGMGGGFGRPPDLTPIPLLRAAIRAERARSAPKSTARFGRSR